MLIQPLAWEEETHTHTPTYKTYIYRLRIINVGRMDFISLGKVEECWCFDSGLMLGFRAPHNCHSMECFIRLESFSVFNSWVKHPFKKCFSSLKSEYAMNTALLSNFSTDVLCEPVSASPWELFRNAEASQAPPQTYLICILTRLLCDYKKYWSRTVVHNIRSLERQH